MDRLFKLKHEFWEKQVIGFNVQFRIYDYPIVMVCLQYITDNLLCESEISIELQMYTYLIVQGVALESTG